MPSSRYYRFKIVDREEKIRRRNMIIFWTVFAGGLITIAWSFFFSPFFRITEIYLLENDMVAETDIQNSIIRNRPLNIGKSLLGLSERRLSDDLAAAFPAITDISVNKEFFHGLTINFEKRLPLGLWCPKGDPSGPAGTVCYFFDKEGIIYKEAPQTEGALILKVINFENLDVLPGQKVLSGDILNFIIAFNGHINESENLKMIEYKIKPAPDIDFEAVTGGGWSVYIDPSRSAAEAAANLFTVLNESVKNNADNLLYVDLRIPSRIFYKMK